MRQLIEITKEPISTDTVVARMANPAVGGIATFIGVVRGETCRHKTQHLEYEAYPEMAVKVLQQIAAEVRARWTDVREVALVHRVGTLNIGETAVIIALSAGHRAQLFDALHYAIDRVKEIAPIWKKEVWVDKNISPEWRSENET